MTPGSRGALVRRVFVTMGAVTTVAGGAFAVRVASELNAAATPSDVAPASLVSVQGQMDWRAARAAALESDIASLNDQVQGLSGSIASASTTADGQVAAGAAVLRDIAAAKVRLAKMQGQLASAKARLAAADAAAVRIAASRPARGTIVATTGASGAAGGGDN
jgi:hypothetical protein